MATVTYVSNICHRQLQTGRYSNKMHWKLQTIPQTMIEAAKGRHYPLSSIYSTCHTPHILKQLYIATLHLNLKLAQAHPCDAKHLSSYIISTIGHLRGPKCILYQW